MALPIPKLDIPTFTPEPLRTHGTPERSVPVSARSRIATAGKVSALTKVYEPTSDSDSDSDAENEHHVQQLRVPPLPLLLDGKCGLPAKPCPARPTLNCVHEDSMLSSDLLSSSEDDEELLVECDEVEAMISHRSALVPLSFRSVLQSEAPTQISLDLSVMSKANRCASASGLGAMAGGAGGAFVGLLSGIIPAPLTFGLSVPINAGIGSIGGMIMGTAGGLICQSMDVVEIEAVTGAQLTQRGHLDTQRTCASSARSSPGVLLKIGAADPQQENQMDARVSCALKGGLAMGSIGGAGGSALGGLVGAAVGLPPAVLTFGLSVPVCATLGSGLGLCIGSVAGGSVGLVGGSLLGHFSPRGRKAPSSPSTPGK